MTTLDLVGTLIAWLRKRGKPDSGIRYEGGGPRYDDDGTWVGGRLSRVELHGEDADFVVKHFHGKGAVDLADALSAVPAQPVGWQTVPVEPTPEMISAHMMADEVEDPREQARIDYAALLAAAPSPAAVAVTDEMVERAVGVQMLRSDRRAPHPATERRWMRMSLEAALTDRGP